MGAGMNECREACEKVMRHLFRDSYAIHVHDF